MEGFQNFRILSHNVIDTPTPVDVQQPDHKYFNSCITRTFNNVLLHFFIHRLNNEYITLLSVPGSLLRSTKEGKLGYFLDRDGNQLIPG